MSLNEENARVMLLGCLMTVYVFFGALIIRKFESPVEKRLLRNYWKMYDDFEEKLTNGTAEVDELKTLLYTYGNMTSTLGVPGQYEKWNFIGSLHFVVTIVTTIGYGSYTPNTNAGKIFVILYGFVGCAGGILFFNLFLERMITFLAFLLRELYVRRLMSRLDATDEHRDVLIADWKPSIYSVMVCLFVSVVSIGSVAVPTYAALEGWSYVETAYYCFVSFATIGFGDYVAAQGWYRHSDVYVLANIFVLAIGCCFLYSVFNVISIVLKQILNWLIDRMKEVGIVCRLRGKRRRSERALRKASLRMQRERRQNHRRRSSIYIVRQRNAATDRQSVTAGENVKIPSPRFGTASGIEVELTDGDARKLSDDGLISMKDFFTSNQVSLALMQKQLQECAQQQSGNWNAETQSIAAVGDAPANAAAAAAAAAAAVTSPIVIVKHRHSHANVAASGSSSTGSSTYRSGFPAGKFIPGTIGPLAILCDKLGDK